MGEEDYSARLLRIANSKPVEKPQIPADDLNKRILERSLQDFTLLDSLTGSRHYVGSQEN